MNRYVGNSKVVWRIKDWVRKKNSPPLRMLVGKTAKEKVAQKEVQWDHSDLYTFNVDSAKPGSMWRATEHQQAFSPQSHIRANHYLPQLVVIWGVFLWTAGVKQKPWTYQTRDACVFVMWYLKRLKLLWWNWWTSVFYHQHVIWQHLDANICITMHKLSDTVTINPEVHFCLLADSASIVALAPAVYCRLGRLWLRGGTFLTHSKQLTNQCRVGSVGSRHMSQQVNVFSWNQWGTRWKHHRAA